MTEAPKRPWWKRRRTLAAAPAWVAASYAAGFVPACWVAVRFDPLPGVAADAVERAYPPVAFALMASPPWAQRGVATVVNVGLPPEVRFRIHSVSVVVS